MQGIFKYNCKQANDELNSELFETVHQIGRSTIRFLLFRFGTTSPGRTELGVGPLPFRPHRAGEKKCGGAQQSHARSAWSWAQRLEKRFSQPWYCKWSCHWRVARSMCWSWGAMLVEQAAAEHDHITPSPTRPDIWPAGADVLLRRWTSLAHMSCGASYCASRMMFSCRTTATVLCKREKKSACF